MSRSKSAKNPPRAVRTERRIRKFPILSAKNPANGGVKINKTGMTALITATSETDNPRDFMCKFRYGYRTVMEADWKKKMSFIQTRCFIRKS